MILTHQAEGGDYEGLEGTVQARVPNDETPTVTLLVTPDSIGEDTDVATMSATLSDSSFDDVTLQVSSAAVEPAVAGDFNLSLNRTLTITAGETTSSGEVTITSVDNVVDAPEKEVTVSATITLELTDDDTAGVTVEPTSALTTTERGVAVTFTVVLDTQPLADVTIGVSSSDTSEGTIPTESATLTFTVDNWNQEQTVTVTGQDDDVADGNQKYTIRLAAAVSTDTSYSGLDPADVTVANTDDDVANLTISSSTVAVDEGSTADYTVVLDTQPLADVTISVARAAGGDVDLTVSPDTLTFTSENWSRPQTVTVSAEQDNDRLDGTATFEHNAESDDDQYDGICIADVLATEADDEGTPTVTITGPSHANALFQVTFTSDEVVYGFTLDDIVVGNAAASSFNEQTTGREWTATITPRDEGIVIIDVAAGAAVDNLSIGNAAADRLSVTYDVTAPTVTITSPSDVNDDFTATFTFDEVVSDFAVGDITVGNGTASEFTETTAGRAWTANISPMAAGSVTLDVSARVVQDLAGNDNSAATRQSTNHEPPTVTLALSPDSVSESADVSTVTASLSSLSSEDVTVTVSAEEVAPAVAGDFSLSDNRILTIAAGSTSSSGVVTITAVNNDVDAPDKTVTASATVTGGNGVAAPSEVTLAITDDDTAGLDFSVSTVALTEGSTASYTIALTSEPTSAVTVAVESDDTTAATVSTASLSFSTANWAIPQTVTLTGVEDVDAEGADVTLTHRGSGGGYAGVSETVLVRVRDNDMPGYDLSAVQLILDEGSTTSYTVTLITQPGAEVTVKVTSPDSGAVMLDPAELSFTTENWNSPQTVTVTGVEYDDASDESVELTLLGSGGDYEGLSTTVMVNVRDTGAAPTAVLDRTTVEQGGSVSIDVLANDYAADGDALTVIAVTQGAHGVVSIDAGRGTVSSTADADFAGADRFTYTIRDRSADDGRSDAGQVLVAVYSPVDTNDTQSTHGIPPVAATVAQNPQGNVTVEFPGGASNDIGFQIRVDYAFQNCDTWPPGRVLAGCAQVQLFQLNGSVWSVVQNGIPFTTANIDIVATGEPISGVYRRDGPGVAWTEIPECSDGAIGECITVSENEVTIRNIERFSQFAVMRSESSSAVIIGGGTVRPRSRVAPTVTPAPSPSPTVPSPTPATALPTAAAPTVVAVSLVPSTMPSLTPSPTAVAAVIVAVPPTEALPTAAPPLRTPTTDVAPTRPEATGTPVPAAAALLTPSPPTTAAPPAVDEPDRGFPMWLIGILAAAAAVVVGLLYGAWRLLRV